jgi:hypothetical protein
MAFFSGNGSLLKIGGASLNCKLTRLRKAARLTENTHSGTSSSNYVEVVPDNSWSASVPWDSSNIPDTGFGLAPGTQVTLVFTLGSSGLSESLTNTTVETVEDVMDNAGDIIRTEITGKGGVLTAAS